MTNIILCADDYGQNTAISQAIIELLKTNRLSATSCITNSYYWHSHAKWLQPFTEQADIGLHFNLTQGKILTKRGLSCTPLSTLMAKAYFRQLNLAAVEAELHAQLDEFISGIGRNPDFIDGHQHILQLPIIRQALLAVYERRLRQTGCYIRSVRKASAYWQVTQSGYFKTVVIQLCGTAAFKKELTKYEIPHNLSFNGFYDFKDAKKYSEIFPKFLADIGEKGIIMCHPGLKNSLDEDSIADSRYFEYQYFASDQFMQVMQGLRGQNITIGRFKV